MVSSPSFTPNRVEKGFGTETNAATVLAADGGSWTFAEQPKEQLADGVWDLVVPRLPSPSVS